MKNKRLDLTSLYIMKHDTNNLIVQLEK